MLLSGLRLNCSPQPRASSGSCSISKAEKRRSESRLAGPAAPAGALGSEAEPFWEPAPRASLPAMYHRSGHQG